MSRQKIMMVIGAIIGAFTAGVLKVFSKVFMTDQALDRIFIDGSSHSPRNVTG
jgi:hypothetical protein